MGEERVDRRRVPDRLHRPDCAKNNLVASRVEQGDQLRESRRPDLREPAACGRLLLRVRRLLERPDLIFNPTLPVGNK
jgi:hypothetical protein